MCEGDLFTSRKDKEKVVRCCCKSRVFFFMFFSPERGGCKRATGIYLVLHNSYSSPLCAPRFSFSLSSTFVCTYNRSSLFFLFCVGCCGRPFFFCFCTVVCTYYTMLPWTRPPGRCHIATVGSKYSVLTKTAAAAAVILLFV